jgi:DNA-binding beta-propeller fold protein YncE
VLAIGLALCLGGRASAADLQLLNEFGSEGSGPGQFGQVEDLEVAPNGNLVLSDLSYDRVEFWTPAGRFVGQFGSGGSGPGQFYFPWGLAIQRDGTIFVVDAGGGRVEVFTPTGTYLREFVLPQLFYADIDLDPAGRSLYLVDYQAGNIQRMSTTGANMGLFGSFGTGNGQFRRPYGIAIDSGGNLFVADRDNHRVDKLSPSGAFLDKFGGQGTGPGKMNMPYDVAVEPNGNVLVADTFNYRLDEFSPTGRFLASYDRIAGSRTPTFTPLAVTTSPSGDIYVYDRTPPAARILRVRTAPSPPVLGKSVNVGVVSGKILVRAKGQRKFHVLSGSESIPVGSSVDATHGRVRLATARKGRGTQRTVFFDGRFSVRQNRRTDLTDIRLEGGGLGSCRGGSRSAKGASTVLRRLWGHGKGHTRTSGHNGSGTVRGTFWLTEDRCDGTLFKVRQGVVVVRDFTRHRTVVLHAGQRYLAPAR